MNGGKYQEIADCRSIRPSKDVTKSRKTMIYNSMFKSVLTYGAETWSLYENDRKGIDGPQMDGLGRSARISKLDTKTNEYIIEKNWTSKIQYWAR